LSIRRPQVVFLLPWPWLPTFLLTMSVFNHAQNAIVQGNVTAAQVYGDQTIYNADVVNVSSLQHGSPLKGAPVMSAITTTLFLIKEDGRRRQRSPPPTYFSCCPLRLQSAARSTKVHGRHSRSYHPRDPRLVKESNQVIIHLVAPRTRWSWQNCAGVHHCGNLQAGRTLDWIVLFFKPNRQLQ